MIQATDGLGLSLDTNVGLMPFGKGSTVKREEILSKLAAGELSVEEANRLLTEDEVNRKGRLFCKVSEKGGISVYGLQRMPVTLYVEQWEKLLDFADEIRAFAKDNHSALKRRDATP